MNMLQSFKLALKSIRSNKMRSFLTMLGIIIGVASVIVLVSLVNAYMSYMTEGVRDRVLCGFGTLRQPGKGH